MTGRLTANGKGLLRITGHTQTQPTLDGQVPNQTGNRRTEMTTLTHMEAYTVTSSSRNMGNVDIVLIDIGKLFQARDARVS